MRKILHALALLWRTITRERAVLAGFAVAVLEAVQAGEITKATAVPVIAGIVLRFFVSPYNRNAPDSGVFPEDDPARWEGDDGQPHGDLSIPPEAV